MNKNSENSKYNHAWNWFALHAQQRQNNIHYSIIVLTAFFGAIAILIQNNIDHIAILGSVVGIALTWLFWGVDKRNSYLIKLSEKYFIEYEKLHQTPDTKYSIFTDADRGRGYLKYSAFSFWFSILVTLVFVSSIIYCTHRLLCPEVLNTYGDLGLI
jgi:hypothetical protein